jgi:hypothetical protein
MSDIAYDAQHSVDAEVSLAFAWDWRTDVRNWDDPPATFRLDGPFGGAGTPDSGSDWPPVHHVTPLDGIDPAATLSFEWVFESLSDRRTRLTQHIRLSGSNAAAHADQVRAGFSATLQDGMERIARAMAAAAPPRLRR